MTEPYSQPAAYRAARSYSTTTLITILLILIAFFGFGVSPAAAQDAVYAEKTVTASTDRINAWTVELNITSSPGAGGRDTLIVADRSGFASEADFAVYKEGLAALAESILTSGTAEARVGLISFDEDVKLIQDLVPASELETLLSAIRSLTPGTAANAQAGLHLAETMIERSAAERRNIVLVLNSGPTASFAISNPQEYSLIQGSELVTNTIVPDFAFNYDLMINDGQVYPDTAPAVTSKAANSLIAESIIARTKGIELFIVSIDNALEYTDQNAASIIGPAYNASLAELAETLQQVAAGALGSPREIVYTEQIELGFEIPDELIESVRVSSGKFTYNKKNDAFTWEPGPFAAGERQTLTYVIRPTKDILQILTPDRKSYPTVATGVLRYRLSGTDVVSIPIEAPEVSPVFIRVDNHLLDGMNQFVNQPDRKFTIELTTENQRKVYEIGAYETKMILDLDTPGTYKVVETDTNLGSIDDYSVMILPSSFTLTPESEPVSLTIVNQIKPGGILTFRQDLIDPSGARIENDSREFNYIIEGPNGYHQKITLSEQAPVTLSELIYGEYQITRSKLSDGYEAAGGPQDGKIQLSEVAKAIEVVMVNRFTPETANIVGKFEWVDGPVRRPDLKVVLYQNDTPVFSEPATVTDGDLQYIWRDVAVTDLHGNPRAFRIGLAEPVPDYVSSYPDSLTIRNQYSIPVDGEAKAAVEWRDGPEVRPTVALQLTRRVGFGGEEAVPGVDPVVLDSGLTEASWSGLERTSLKGDVYRFGVRQGIIEDGTFKQARLKDYDTAINGLTVTNQYVVRNDGQVVAQVEWLNGDPDNRPTVFGRLYRQLAGQTEARIAPDTTIARFSKIDGKIIWNGLEMTTIQGEPYIFSVRQVNLAGDDFTPPNYTKTETGLTVTNSYVPPANGSAKASVLWVDGPTEKPDIDLQLMRSAAGREAEPVPDQDAIALSAGETEGDWSGLEETDLDGNPYTFSVRVGQTENGEFVPRDPYAYAVSVDGLNVTNTFIVTTDASAKAVIDWTNGSAANRPTIYLRLYRQSEEEEREPVPTVGLVKVENGAPTASWENLERTDRFGNPYTFSVEPVASNGRPLRLDDYETTADGLTVTNRYVIPTNGEIQAEIIWNGGIRGERPTVWLKPRRAVEGGEPQDIPGAEPIEIPSGTTQAAWYGLERTDLAGNAYNFTVIEGQLRDGVFVPENPLGYERAEMGTIVTNTYIVPRDGSAVATVLWENGPEDSRPEIYLKLNRRIEGASVEEVPEATIQSVPNGVATVLWTGLEVTTIDGDPYIFSVSVVNSEGESSDPENYSALVNGMTVVNRYVIPTNAEATASIEWMNGALVPRPSFQLALVRSVMGGEAEPVPNTPRRMVENDMTTVHWDGLEVGDLNGNPYQFSVRIVNNQNEETTIPDYSSLIDGLIVRNVFIVPTDASATARVNWIDGPKNNRPPIWLSLFRRSDPDAIPEAVPNAQILAVPAGESSVTWDNLDATDLDGRPYEFSVRLVNAGGEIFFLANYEKIEDGMTITNRYMIPRYASAQATLSWVDGDGSHRPDTWLRLMRSVAGGAPGPVPDAPIVKMIHGMTTASWDNLEATDAEANTYTFSVMETDETGKSAAPKDYLKTENGMSVVNTYQIPFDYDAEGHVVWQGGTILRPTVYLKLFRKSGENGVIETVPDAVVKALVNGVTVVKWTDLPRTDIAGTPYFYSVRPVNEQGGDLVLDRYVTAVDGLTVTNTFVVPKTGTARGTVQWKGGPKDNRPTVRLKLQRQIDIGYPEDVPNAEIKVLPNGTTSVEWTDLEETDIYGNEYLFTIQIVDEAGEPTNAPGYLKKLSGQVVINTYIIPTDGVVDATKVWIDGPEDDRPTTWFRVYRRIGDEAEILIPGSKIVELPSGVTTAHWDGLESTDINGIPYQFSVREVDSLGRDTVPVNYVKSESGLRVTNTYMIPMNGAAVAEIEWVDAPADVPAVWFKLFRNVEGGPLEEVPDAILKQLNGSVRSVAWANLESTNRAGAPYIFSVQEVNAYGLDFVPEGYEKEENGLTVVNRFIQ